jgi:long-chain acyl-CoA synthetase
MVHGDRRPHLVALLVADPDHGGDLAAAVRRVNAKLGTIERIRHFVTADEPFTTENAMMTPSLKIRRHVIREKYGDKLDALYG